MRTIDVLVGELKRQASGEAPNLRLQTDAAGRAAFVDGQIDVAALAEAIERQLLVPQLRLPMRSLRFQE